jgi:hypothetical protein
LELKRPKNDHHGNPPFKNSIKLQDVVFPPSLAHRLLYPMSRDGQLIRERGRKIDAVGKAFGRVQTYLRINNMKRVM